MNALAARRPLRRHHHRHAADHRSTAFGIWFERKFAARMQSRLGPTIVGPVGLLQPVADVLKLLQKEDIIPRDADHVLFNLAPVLAPSSRRLGAAAVVPFSPTASRPTSTSACSTCSRSARSP